MNKGEEDVLLPPFYHEKREESSPTSRRAAGAVKEDGRGQNPTEIEESPVFGVFSVGIGEKRKEEAAGG